MSRGIWTWFGGCQTMLGYWRMHNNKTQVIESTIFQFHQIWLIFSTSVVIRNVLIAREAIIASVILATLSMKSKTVSTSTNVAWGRLIVQRNQNALIQLAHTSVHATMASNYQRTETNVWKSETLAGLWRSNTDKCDAHDRGKFSNFATAFNQHKLTLSAQTQDPTFLQDKVHSHMRQRSA
jgi:hypothetical protein